jgi:hypothetical protein
MKSPIIALDTWHFAKMTNLKRPQKRPPQNQNSNHNITKTSLFPKKNGRKKWTTTVHEVHPPIKIHRE